MEDPLPLNRQTYVRLTLTRLWDDLPLVLLSALIFNLLCVPAILLSFSGLLISALIISVVTAVPGWTALLAQEAEIAQGVRTNIGKMLRALPHYWFRSVRLGLLAIFPPLAALFTLPWLALPKVPTVVWLGLAADGLGTLLLIAMFLYAFPLLVLHDMGVRAALRNAWILASRRILNTVGLLSLGIVFAFATVYLSSGLLLFLPAVWGMFIVNNCRLVVGEEMGQD